jgi:hypothetical protein
MRASVVLVLGGMLLVGGCSGEPEGGTPLPGDPSTGNGSGSGSGPSGSGNASSSGTSGGPTGSTGGTQPNPQDLFTNNVYPMLMGLNCKNCHAGSPPQGPTFLKPTADATYALMKDQTPYVQCPTTSKLPNRGPHAGPALSQADHDIVAEWLTAEAEAKGGAGACDNAGTGGDPPMPLSPMQAITNFGTCIKLADWQQLNITELCNQTAKNQNNNVPCSSCHSIGEKGTYISCEELQFYEKTKQMAPKPYLLKFASAVLDDNGAFKDIAKANRWIEKGQEDCPIGQCHPPFVLDQNVVDAINQLFDLTYDHWTAAGKQACAAAPLPPQQ